MERHGVLVVTRLLRDMACTHETVIEASGSHVRFLDGSFFNFHRLKYPRSKVSLTGVTPSNATTGTSKVKPMEDQLKDGNRLLRDTLRKLNQGLANRLETLWQTARKEIHPFQEGKTNQGTDHCLAVENNIGILLEAKIDKFKDKDLFILSAAAALHDIGKIKRQISGVQLDHGQWGRELLKDREISRHFLDDERMAIAIAEVVGVHENGLIDDLPEELFSIGAPPRVPLRSLAAIFRLADMCDTDYNRVPWLLKEMRAVRFVENPEVWLARHNIVGWHPSSDGKSIVLTVSSCEDKDYRAAYACKDLLNGAITVAQQTYLQNCPVTYMKEGIKEDTVHFPFRFQIDTSQIEKQTGDLEVLRTRARREYLKRLSHDFSRLDLDGIGEFADKKPTRLQDVFIDVEVEFAADLRPRWVQAEEEKLEKIHRIEKLEQTSLPRTNVQRLIEKSVPVTSVVDDDQLGRIVLLGDPGSGKSTIVQYLAWSSASEPVRQNGEPNSKKPRLVPFRVLIREFVREKKEKGRDYSLIHYVNDEVEFHLRAGKCPEGFVESLLSTGQAIVIFDGLDEVLDPYERERIHKEIMHFIGLFPEAKYLVTSRTAGYRQNMLDPEEFTHLLLLPLGEKQIHNFIERWYRLREFDPRMRKARIAGLKGAINDSEISQLARNPLLLTIMALVHKNEADLPRQRVPLYEKCVQAFLVSRDKARDLLSYDEYDIRSCHEYLGYQMQKKLVYAEVDTNEFRDMLFSFFTARWPLTPLDKQKEKIDEFIDMADRRGGIIVQRHAGFFCFGHRSFQEFFAACYLVSNGDGSEEIWDTVKDKLFNPPWHETMKMLGAKLGYVASKTLDQFVQKLLSVDPRGYKAQLYENVLLAGEIAAERTPMNGATLVEICNRVIDVAHKSGRLQGAAMRARALITLLSEGPAKEYVLRRAKEILQRGTGVESILRRTLETIVRRESPF